MKKLIFILAIFAATTTTAQKVTQDANGNWKQSSFFSAKDSSSFVATGKTFTDNKGNVYQVFLSKRGFTFYNRVSKSGNKYRAYLKVS